MGLTRLQLIGFDLVEFLKFLVRVSLLLVAVVQVVLLDLDLPMR